MLLNGTLMVGQSKKESIRLDENLINEIKNKYCIYIQRRRPSHWNWTNIKKTVLVWRRGKDSSTAKRIPLKRIIMGIKKNQPVEIRHLNGDPLDLRRSNLEIIPSFRGKKNKSKLKKRS